MKKTIQVILSFVWLGVIAYFFYFQNHPYYFESLTFIGRIAPTILVFVALAAALIGAQLLWNHYKKRPLLELKLTLWKALLSFFVLATGIFMVSQIGADLAIYHGGTVFQDELGWGVMPEGLPLEPGMVAQVDDGTIVNNSTSFISLMPEEVAGGFTQVSLVKGLAFTFWQLIQVLGFLAILSVATYSIGRKIARKNFFVSTAVGLGVYMAVMFVLGLFGLINPWAVGGAAVVLTGVAWKEAYDFVKKAITGSIKTEIDYKSLSFWILMAAVLVFVHNALELIRPMPIGWDDVNYYAYIPEKIASLGELMKGSGGMYNWELISSIGAFKNDAMFILFTNFWGGLLAFGAIYLLLKEFLSKKTSVMLASFFAILPAIIFQQSLDVKNDLPLLFFSLISVYTFIKWAKGGKSSWLYLAAVFIGIAIGIKTIAGTLLILMLIFLGWKGFKKEGALAVGLGMVGAMLATIGKGNLYEIPANLVFMLGVGMFIAGVVAGILALRKITSKKVLKSIGIFLTIIFLVSAPWIGKNLAIDGKPLAMGTFIGSDPNTAHVDFQEYLEDCSEPTLDDELSQYITGDDDDREKGVKPIDLAKMPWQITMNPGVEGIYIDISFIFLGLLPLFLWYLGDRSKKSFKVVAGASALYFFLIIFFLNGVIWYGFPGICLLLILVGQMMETYDKDSWREEKMLGVAIKAAIGLTAISVVFVRIASWGDLEDLAYLGGIIDSDEYIEAVAPGTADTIEYLKQVDDLEYLFAAGGVTAYFTAGMDVKLYKDEVLDYFACMREHDANIDEVYKEAGIRYIAIDYTVFIEDQEELHPAVVDRYINFLDYGIAKWETPVARPDYILFRIP